MSYVLLVIGFILLVKGADYFVDGASNIAKILKISPLIIGLTIVAFGTSAPEAAVSITASISGQNDMSMGNVVGSNIFNLLMVVGMSGFIHTLIPDKSLLNKDFPFLILVSFVLFILSIDTVFQGGELNSLTRSDGLILIAFFMVFMYSIFRTAFDSRSKSIEESSISIDNASNYDDSASTLTEITNKNTTMSKSITLTIVGLIAIVIGGDMVVNSASDIATQFGVSQQIIGLTIVAIGTSLPEFVTSIVAATKGESDIALGNVVGSNLFNILFVLGISAVINPITVSSAFLFDFMIMLTATILTYLFALRKKDINKFECIILMGIYIVYISKLVMGL